MDRWPDMRQWVGELTEISSVEALVANKDKGAKSTKKVAAKDLKQKRIEKKAKKEGQTKKVV